MTRRRDRGSATSVRTRLLALSKDRGEEFQRVLVRFGIERLLYRLSQSEHASGFVLKGATLFAVWTETPHRPTKDLELLGLGSPDPDRLVGTTTWSLTDPPPVVFDDTTTGYSFTATYNLTLSPRP